MLDIKSASAKLGDLAVSNKPIIQSLSTNPVDLEIADSLEPNV